MRDCLLVLLALSSLVWLIAAATAAVVSSYDAAAADALLSLACLLWAQQIAKGA